MRAVVSIDGTLPIKISKYLGKAIHPTITKTTQRVMHSEKVTDMKILDISIETMKIITL